MNKINTLRFLPALGWAGVIFYLSNQPGRSLGLNPVVQEMIAMSVHFVEYSVLTFLILWGLKRALSAREKVGVLLVILLYAVSDEFHQSFVPHRTPSILDLGIDVIASLSVIYVATHKILEKYYKKWLDNK